MMNHPFSRRRFLAVGIAATALVSLAGCEAGNPNDLDEFLDLSALLTGFEKADLDPRLARIYLDTIHAMVAASPDSALEKLYRKAGFRTGQKPRTYDEMEAKGAFDDATANAVAEEIMLCWYSGTIPSGGALKIRVATYDTALAWKSITWTTPNMECRGALGAWSEPPRVTVT
jgi:hypothetical protein